MYLMVCPTKNQSFNKGNPSNYWIW